MNHGRVIYIIYARRTCSQVCGCQFVAATHSMIHHSSNFSASILGIYIAMYIIQRVDKLRYCSKATSQTHATFCDLRARIECNECVLSMRTSLDFRILYAKTNVAKESSATGCKYIDRFIRRRVFFVNLA